LGIDGWYPAGTVLMMNVAVRDDGEPGVEMTLADQIETRRVRTVDDVKHLLADRGDSLTDTQHHGIGLVTAVLAMREYSGQYRPDQLGKVLDAVYFPASSPAAGQAFSRGMGEATFALRRADDPVAAATELLASARRDFES
jgi:hypothetical protein